MKKLSIEEKAKAYDEALKVLHKYDGAHIMFTQDLKEEMFPELAESEDEKIRQLLLRFVKYDMSDNYSDDFTPADCVAWLEKQSKQKYTQRDIDDAYLKGIADVKREVEKIDEQTEKMKKEIAEFIFNSKEDIKQRYEWIKCLGFDVKFSNEEKQDEQKPSWSEEDIEMIDTIEWELHGTRYPYYPKSKDKIHSWLQSLKERVQLQPKQEWSEEDRIHYNKCLQYLESISPRKEDIEWFKSLRPQSKWKPSERQIYLLNWVANILLKDDSIVEKETAKELRQLLEQLKKLREE